MKKNILLAAIFILIFISAFGIVQAQFKIRAIKFTGIFDLAFKPEDLLAATMRPDFAITVDWAILGAKGDEKVNIALLKDDLVKRQLASGVGHRFVKDEKYGQKAVGYFYFYVTAEDAGCHYQLRLITTDNALKITSHPFNIYPAFDFKKNGVETSLRLDTPKGGEELILDRDYHIQWTAIANSWHFSTGKIEFELLANVNNNVTVVGRICTIYLDFKRCMIFNTYSWRVGRLHAVYDPAKKPDGTNGIKYRIRLRGDTSQWDSDDFKIVRFHVGEKPLEKK